MDKCPYCQTDYKEILQTGFVGCQHCYFEIEPLKRAVEKLYDGKIYRGKRGDHGSF